MRTLVRSASLTDYLEVARTVGLDPSRMLAGVGLSRRCLQNPDFRVPEEAVRQLLESSAAAAGVEDFGLRMAERRTLSNLGPLALLLRDQPTIRQAIEAWKLNSKVHTESVSVRIDENDGIAIISMVRSIESFAPKRQGVEMTVGVLYRTMRQFLGDGWRPRVCFVHSAPRNLDTHRRVFGSKVEFNCDFNGIICCTSDLDTPIAAADPAMARYAQQYVDSIKPSEGSFGERVRELVSVAAGFRRLPDGAGSGADGCRPQDGASASGGRGHHVLGNRRCGPHRIGEPLHRESRAALVGGGRDARILALERIFTLVQETLRAQCFSVASD